MGLYDRVQREGEGGRGGELSSMRKKNKNTICCLNTTKAKHEDRMAQLFFLLCNILSRINNNSMFQLVSSPLKFLLFSTRLANIRPLNRTTLNDLQVQAPTQSFAPADGKVINHFITQHCDVTIFASIQYCYHNNTLKPF